MAKHLLKPAKAEIKVRDPLTKMHLKAEGEKKEMSSYWMRRIIDGDVLDCTPAPGAEPVKPAAPKVSQSKK